MTCGNLAPEGGALGPFRIVVDRVWSIASEVGYSRHLGVRIRQTVGEDNASQVNVLQRRRRGCCLLQLSVLLVNDRSNVGGVCAAIALSGDVEGRVGILGITSKEELQESINVDCRSRASVDG